MNDKKRIRKTYYLTSDLINKIELIKRAQHKSASEVVRNAIMAYQPTQNK